MAKKRTLIVKGCYKDRFGTAIIVSVSGQPREFRKNEQNRKYSTFTPEELKRERIRIQAREQLKHERQIITGETFAADVDRFLNTLSGGHKVNTTGYMRHWAVFNERQRNTITDLEVQTAFASIQKGNSTKRHIRRALVSFYETLNGVSGYNPARVLIPPPKPPEEARDIPYQMIEKIFKALVPSRARARLKVLAYVGLPHKQIKLLQPSDLRLDDHELIAHPRRKGAGAHGRGLPLSDLGKAALQEFVELDAFGSFQNAQLVRTFRLGATRAGLTLAPDARPYDLRHSFLTELARSGADIQDIANLGMHATLEQAARYTKGAASERATKAIKAVPRFSTTTKPAKRPIRSTSVQSRRRKHRPRTR
jgi:integrase